MEKKKIVTVVLNLMFVLWSIAVVASFVAAVYAVCAFWSMVAAIIMFPVLLIIGVSLWFVGCVIIFFFSETIDGW